MDIDDILSEPHFKRLDEKHKDLMLKDIMHSTAGKELMKSIVSCFGNEKSAREWYFSCIRALEYKRPYDLCSDGKHKKVYDEIIRIEHGVYY